jgi:hypothetical protein
MNMSQYFTIGGFEAAVRSCQGGTFFDHGFTCQVKIVK